MITKTNLTIIHDGKRINVYTLEELKNTNLKNRFLTSLDNLLKTYDI